MFSRLMQKNYSMEYLQRCNTIYATLMDLKFQVDSIESEKSNQAQTYF